MSSASDPSLPQVIGSAPIRLGIVGCGRVTEACHLPALQGLEHSIDVVALADADEHRLRRVGGMFDIAGRFANLETMLRDAGPIDAIAVCTPTESHAEVVIAALDAGKHVLVEKPLALTLDEADRILAAVESHPKQKLMLGFNLRHHRLVRQAKQMITAGVLGDISLLRTLWTSSMRTRMKMPAWRDRRASGGGVLSELAVHHIDLMRFLTDSEIAAVFSQNRHGEGDDQAAAILMRLSNDATVSASFSEQTSDINEIELIGTKGRLSFSLYRFDSLQFIPAGSYGSGRAAQLFQTLKQLPAAWPILRRGGDFRESYRQQWLCFADALRNDHPPVATAADGYEALRVVLAAGASANLGKAIAIADAPREPQAVSIDRSLTTTEPVTMEQSDRPELSAVLATRRSFESIRKTVRHLRAQTVRDKIELLIVCPNKTDLHADEDELKDFWGYRILEVGQIDSVARTNAAGARAASAAVVVCCEDHSFPEPTWAEKLLEAHHGPYAAVGPAIYNANPRTRLSRADFLLGYGPWAAPIEAGEMEHLPGHNTAYKRDILLSYGDRLGEMMEAESVLQWDMRRKGHRLYLQPAARVAHTNFSRLKPWAVIQFHCGRIFAGTRAADWPAAKRILYCVASPLIPLVRFVRIWRYSRRIARTQQFGPAVYLTLMWALISDGAGQMLGYAAGAGKSLDNAHEFDRLSLHITAEDRRQLEDTQPPLQPS